VKFSTVALGVADPAASERFYVEGLGLPVDSRPLPGLVYLASGATRIALYPAERLAEYAAVEARPAGGTVLALNFDSAEAVDRCFARACAVGGTPLREARRMDWGGWAATLRDPDGHVFELVFAPDDQSPAKS